MKTTNGKAESREQRAEIKHTPGAWHVEGNGKTRESDIEPRHVRVLSPHANSHGPIEKQIAVVYYGETDAEREANARLIAAAPELLAAALLLVSDWKWKCGTTYTAHNTQPLIDAIAKATGQS